MGCGQERAAPRPITLKEGLRGCTTLADAVKFEEIERARDWKASMEMIRSGRCIFAAPGDTIFVVKVEMDGSTLFRERGKIGNWWTKEAIKSLANDAK